jgi:hypothetical protein
VSQATSGQLEPLAHDPCALQSTSHAHAVVQVIGLSHESGPQVMPHLPGPHVIGELHDCPPAQLIVQASLAAHAIGESQASWPQVIVVVAAFAAIDPLHD